MKINRTGNLPESVNLQKAEEVDLKTPSETAFRPGVAGASDSFVHSSAEKSPAMANQPDAPNNLGQRISPDEAEKIKNAAAALHPPVAVIGVTLALIEPAIEKVRDAAKRKNADILKPGPESPGAASPGNSYFSGKQLSAQDLQKDQEYQRGKSQGAAKTRHFFTDHVTTAVNLQREQDYNKAGRNPARADSGLASSAAHKVIAARANAALDRLASLTGIPPEELRNLLNKYGVDAGNPPNPPNDQVNAFIRDPAFAACPPQALLQALYDQLQ